MSTLEFTTSVEIPGEGLPHEVLRAFLESVAADAVITVVQEDELAPVSLYAVWYDEV